jgi:hypothetical protein
MWSLSMTTGKGSRAGEVGEFGVSGCIVGSRDSRQQGYIYGYWDKCTHSNGQLISCTLHNMALSSASMHSA